MGCTLECGQPCIAWFQTISIPTPRKVNGVNGSCEGEPQKLKFLKKSMKLNWNFQRGGGYGYFLEQHIHVEDFFRNDIVMASGRQCYMYSNNIYIIMPKIVSPYIIFACKNKTTYAAVLPDPVLALAKISFPSRAKGMAFSCQTVGPNKSNISIRGNNVAN